MKPINFLNFQDQKKNSFKQWLIISIILSICMLFLLAIMSLRQIRIYAELKRKKANLNKNIQQQYQSIEKYHASRKQYTNYQKLVTLSREPRVFPDKYLNLLSSAMPINIFLSDFSYSLKNKIIIKGKATSTRAITDFIRNIIAKPEFKSVALLQVASLREICTYEIQLTL